MKKDIIYTIGYSSCSSILEFLEILNKYKINVVIDVRSTPYSSYYTDYDKENLYRILKSNNIIYRNYKDEFGIKKDNPIYFTDDYFDFNKFARSDIFNEGINKVKAGIDLGYRFILMCAEKDPSNCHRSIMVARRFYEEGFDVCHLIGKDRLLSQKDLEENLIEEYYTGQLDMFNELEIPREEKIKNAYIKRNKMIYYRNEGKE